MVIREKLRIFLVVVFRFIVFCGTNNSHPIEEQWGALLQSESMSCNWINKTAEVRTCHLKPVVHHALAAAPYQPVLVEHEVVVNRIVRRLIEILEKLIDFLLQVEAAAFH